jgi:predicted TIM-barrel fold metal-dependent hydrolase
VPITDGWFNVFRLSEDEPVQEIDAFLEPGDALFGGGGGPAWMATTLGQGLEAMDAAGCERAVLTVRQDGRTSVVSRPPTIDAGLEMVTRAPDRLRIALQLDDISSPVSAARCVAEAGTLDEMVMVGVWPSFLECDLNDRRLYPVYTACVEAGLPVRINIGIVGPAWSSKYQDPMLLEGLLIDFPELTVIGAHMGHPWEHLVMRLIMKFQNLHLMTSAYLPKYFHPDLVKFMGSSRGRGRIMFASDFPVIPVARAIEEARKLPIGEDALDDYLGTALCGVLGWK